MSWVASNKTLKKIRLVDSNSRGFDRMTDDELVDYFNKNNMFENENQNSDEWGRAFIRMREKYGSPQPDPITGLGVLPRNEK